MTKEEKRKLIKDSFTIAMRLDCGLCFILFYLCVIDCIIFETIGIEYISLLLFEPLILLILLFIDVLMVKYNIMSKQKKEKEKNIEYINNIFQKNNVVVYPKKIKAYENMFEHLEITHSLRYFATSTDEKIIIFMNIDNEDVIKIEEVDKEDFLEFYFYWV